MKIPLSVLAIFAIFYGFFWFTASTPDADIATARTDMPWQVKALASGNSQVFDLVIGESLLSDAVNKFGEIENIAVFEPNNGEQSLEVYFGNVLLGPLKGKVVISLQADSVELEALIKSAAKREGSATGDWKYILNSTDKSLLQSKKITVITFVPATRALDAAFFRARFGEPVAWLKESEKAVSWFYPDIGLSILIDDEYKEVLEYTSPKVFKMPADVTYFNDSDQ